MTEVYQEKLARLDAAIRLEKPDRVPFAPKVGLYCCYNYGVSAYDVMKDYRNAEPAIRAYLKDLDPDLAWAPPTYPIDPLEALESHVIRWPGPEHKLPLNSSFQHLDGTYLEDDEFDEFLLDPTHFIITKVLPRKYAKLKGLEKIRLNEIYDQSFLMEQAPFGDADVIGALMALVHAGHHAQDKARQARYINDIIVEQCHCPCRGGVACAPFDIYADSLRGLVQSVMDIKLYPEETLACVQRIGDISIPRAVEKAKARGDRLLFIPLHAGIDDFMSPQDYETFYWPGLKRLMTELIRAGITPYVFCEGKYNSRLEIISDVPKGKVIYMFEQVDMKRAKEIVGKVACIGGNLSTATLAFGTKEQVVNETRQLIDLCAPGGGFFMDCSLVIDNAKQENMLAWKQATLEYGRY